MGTLDSITWNRITFALGHALVHSLGFVTSLPFGCLYLSMLLGGGCLPAVKIGEKLLSSLVIFTSSLEVPALINFFFFFSINAMLENARFTILKCCINISGADVL